MNQFRLFATNVFWQYTATASAILAEFATIILVSRALDVKAVGIMSFGYAFAFLVNQFFDIRSTELVIKYLTDTLRDRDAATSVSWIWASFLAEIIIRGGALITTLLAAWIGLSLGLLDAVTAAIVALSALVMYFNTMVTGPARGVLRVLRCFQWQALVTVICALLKVGFVFAALTLTEPKLTHVIAALALASLATPLTYWLLTCRSICKEIRPVAVLRMRLSEARQAQPVRALVNFTKHQYITSLTMIPTKELDINLLTSVAGFEVVGLYKIAKNVVSAMGSLPDAVFLVVYPELARYVARQAYTEMWGFLRRLTLIMGIAGICGYAIACLVFPEFAALVFGEEFRAASKYFNLLLLGFVVWTPLVWLNPLLLAAGRPEIISRGAVVGSVLVLLMYVILGKSFGAMGVALATALATPVVLGSIALFARRAKVFASLTLQSAEAA